MCKRATKMQIRGREWGRFILAWLLVLPIITNAYDVDFKTRTEMLECRKKHSDIREMANVMTGAFWAMTIQNDKSWDNFVYVINGTDKLREAMMSKCGVKTQKAFIDTAHDMNATLDIVGEFIKLGFVAN